MHLLLTMDLLHQKGFPTNSVLQGIYHHIFIFYVSITRRLSAAGGIPPLQLFCYCQGNDVSISLLDVLLPLSGSITLALHYHLPRNSLTQCVTLKRICRVLELVPMFPFPGFNYYQPKYLLDRCKICHKVIIKILGCSYVNSFVTTLHICVHV